MHPVHRLWSIPHRILIAIILAIAGNFVSAQNNFWQPLDGPNGIRDIAGVARHPDGKLFMVARNKVYCSADDGNSWSESVDGLPMLLYFRHFYPSPSGAFYMHLDYGDAIFRFDSGNDEWIPAPVNIGVNSGFKEFDIDPQGRIWVTAFEGDAKIFYSADEAQSFQQIQPDIAIPGLAGQLATFNDDHNLIAADLNVYHFNKNGTTQLVLNGIQTSLIEFDPHTGTAYWSGNDANKRSTDGGLTWDTLTLVPNQQYQPQILNLTFEPGGKTWAHTNGALYWSVDNGANWTKDAYLASNDNGIFFSGDTGEWFLTNNCAYPNFGRTTDAGVTWTDISTGFRHPIVQRMTKDGEGNLYAHSCRRNAYERSNDGGQSWEDILITDSAATYVYGLASRLDGTMMAIGKNGKYYRSFNNGISWEAMTNLDSLSETPGTGTSFFTDWQGVFYNLGNFGDAFKSTDNGNSWQPLDFTTNLYFTPAFHPNGDIYISEGSVIKVYYDGQGNGSELMFNGQPLTEVYNVHCTNDGLTILSASQDINGSSLFRIVPDGSYNPEPIAFGQTGISAITSNAVGDIFVAASGLLYRSQNDGATWTDIGAIPASGFPYHLYVAADQYLYACFNDDVIYRSAQPTTENNFVLGKVWLDDDGACNFDSGEQLKPSVAITATGNGDYTSFSGYNGNFTLSAPAGAYVLNAKMPNALYEPCFSDIPVTLDGSQDSAFVDLPLKAVVHCPYLSVNLTTPILRRCFDITYTVRYKNDGTASATGTYVEIALDSFFIFQSSTVPVASQNGFTYTFNLGDLPPGQSGSFNIVLNVSCEASLSQSHCIAAHIFPDQLCLPNLPPRAHYRECRANIGSFDPNDKRAFVDGKEEPGYVLPNTDIEYLIRFQNTGTDTAFRVVVEDRLSTLLDLSTVTPLVSSHPYSLEVHDQRVLRFVFDNILLPDSNINVAASNGFVKFRVSQMPDVALGSIIRNQADIFFDFNAPVRTNEANLVVGTVSTDPEPGNSYVVTAYPNPFSEWVTFEIAGPAFPGNATFRLFDALGRQVRREEFAGKKFVIQRLTLDTGLYYFLIESEGKSIGTGKIMAK